ncbi:MAG: DUF3267 domain-containing protein [Eubacteriaceae bacterium]
MRYVKKIPETDKELSKYLISQGWTKLKEPSNFLTATLLSVPFMLVNAIIFMIFAYNLYTPLQEFLNNDQGFSFTLRCNTYSLIMYVIAIYVFVIAHEFIHACFIPNIFKSDKTCWGINIFAGFVCTTEKIKKGRAIVISIMPFILLSILLPLILNVFGWLNGYVLFLSLINAFGSSVDFLNLCIVAVQVPNGSYIISNGFETYYK